jgi:hypothetical protein
VAVVDIACYFEGEGTGEAAEGPFGAREGSPGLGEAERSTDHLRRRFQKII